VFAWLDDKREGTVISTSRRIFATGVAGFAVFGPLPHLRSACAEEPDLVTLRTPSGRDVKASLSIPAANPAPAVILIHGSFGLIDFYRSLPAAFSKEGFVALAVDLFDGMTTNDLAQGGRLASLANGAPERATETLVAWIDWLKADPRTTKKIAAIGWSFGAKWALIASSVAALDAAVLYYGGTETWEGDLKGLKAPILGHFAERDTDPRPSTVTRFAAGMEKAGRTLDVRWYAADHAFFNPTHPNYDKVAAEASWQATLKFLHANLG
jgi:carboxymethylenebutenolidase